MRSRHARKSNGIRTCPRWVPSCIAFGSRSSGSASSKTRPTTSCTVGNVRTLSRAKGAAHQNIGAADSPAMQGSMQLACDADAGARQGTRIAKSSAGTVVAAGARPLSDLWLNFRPSGRPVSPTGIKNNRGRPAPHAVEIQPEATHVNQLAGARVHKIRWRELGSIGSCWPSNPAAEMSTANRKLVRNCLTVCTSRGRECRRCHMQCECAHDVARQVNSRLNACGGCHANSWFLRVHL
jgi:hypothetical protein